MRSRLLLAGLVALGTVWLVRSTTSGLEPKR